MLDPATRSVRCVRDDGSSASRSLSAPSGPEVASLDHWKSILRSAPAKHDASAAVARMPTVAVAGKTRSGGASIVSVGIGIAARLTVKLVGSLTPPRKFSTSR